MRPAAAAVAVAEDGAHGDCVETAEKGSAIIAISLPKVARAREGFFVSLVSIYVWLLSKYLNMTRTEALDFAPRRFALT